LALWFVRDNLKNQEVLRVYALSHMITALCDALTFEDVQFVFREWMESPVLGRSRQGRLLDSRNDCELRYAHGLMTFTGGFRTFSHRWIMAETWKLESPGWNLNGNASDFAITFWTV
jgi:hypothetical protein